MKRMGEDGISRKGHGGQSYQVKGVRIRMQRNLDGEEAEVLKVRTEEPEFLEKQGNSELEGAYLLHPSGLPHPGLV